MGNEDRGMVCDFSCELCTVFVKFDYIIARAGYGWREPPLLSKIPLKGGRCSTWCWASTTRSVFPACPDPLSNGIMFGITCQSRRLQRCSNVGMYTVLGSRVLCVECFLLEGLRTILGAESAKHIESLGALLSFQE